VNICVNQDKNESGTNYMQRESLSNTFELEEHKLSEIIKSSEKHTGEIESATPLLQSDTPKYDFMKKEPIRQNLQKNLYPQSKGNSAKNIWSSQQQKSQNSNNYLESFHRTKHSGSGTLGISISQNESIMNEKMVNHLRRKLICQSKNNNYKSSLKSKSKGKLFSMRKQAKLSQQSSAKNSNYQRLDSNLLSTPQQNNHLSRRNAKFLIDRAKLSREDFNFPKQKLNSLFEMRKQKSSKKSLLEKKIMLQAKYSRNRTPNIGVIPRKQNSIFEETQAKFEQNASSTRAVNLLQKIVTKERSPINSIGVKKNKKKRKPSNMSNTSNRFKIERTRTRDFGEKKYIQSGSRYVNNKENLSKGESLDLSKTSHNNAIQNQTGNKKNGKFYYKKSLQKQFYNQEVRLK
jgi:hypothetical protein